MSYYFKDQKTAREKLEWVCWKLKHKYSDANAYVRNLLFTRSHIIRTGLKPGQWHETETQMVHAIFSALVDYVEIQMAWMGTWSDENYKSKFFRRFRKFRSREYAEKRFDWETSLILDESMGVYPVELKYGQPTLQAISAMKQRNLYHFWVDKRPTRPDAFPNEDPWDKEMAWKRFLIYLETCVFPVTDELREHYDWKEGTEMPVHTQMFIEAYYNYEDTEMTKAVIDIRTHLWT